MFLECYICEYCLLCVFDNYYFYGLTDMVYLVCDAFEYVDNLFEFDYLYCIGIVFEQFDGEVLKHFIGLALYLVQFVAIFLYFACFFLKRVQLSYCLVHILRAFEHHLGYLFGSPRYLFRFVECYAFGTAIYLVCNVVDTVG